MGCDVSSFLFSEVNKNNSMKSTQYKMVRLQGEILNQLFSVLGEWNRNVKGYFEESSASILLTELPPEPSPDM